MRRELIRLSFHRNTRPIETEENCLIPWGYYCVANVHNCRMYGVWILWGRGAGKFWRCFKEGKRSSQTAITSIMLDTWPRLPRRWRRWALLIFWAMTAGGSTESADCSAFSECAERLVDQSDWEAPQYWIEWWSCVPNLSLVRVVCLWWLFSNRVVRFLQKNLSILMMSFGL